VSWRTLAVFNIEPVEGNAQATQPLHCEVDIARAFSIGYQNMTCPANSVVASVTVLRESMTDNITCTAVTVALDY
jgi:hypothetical protein